MKFTILGSGGAFQIPRAGCKCRICTEAREKGAPYRRRGQSMYFHELSMLFDTPECISQELNENQILDIQHILYSHFHPDHTMGMRIIEEIKDFKNEEPIVVNLPKRGINLSINEFSSLLNYYESRNLCVINYEMSMTFGGCTIKRIPLANGYAYGFLMTYKEKKVFYCPCHVRDLETSIEALKGCDLMILGMGEINYPDEECTDFRRDTLKIVDHYRPKKVVMIHIEETDGLSYDDFCKLEIELKDRNICFAYDGMDLEI